MSVNKAVAKDPTYVLGLLRRNASVEAMADYLQSCRLLFRGTHGLGMSYFIGYREEDDPA